MTAPGTRDHFDGCDNVPLFDLEPMMVQLGPISPTSSTLTLADAVAAKEARRSDGGQLTLPAELLPVASGEMFS